MSKNADKIFVLLVLFCVYAWLTVLTTSDASLLSNNVTTPLPIIGTAIPIAGFYWVAPLLLGALYIHFHLQLQALWDALAELPDIFPDGKSRDERVYPWLLKGFASAQRPTLTRAQSVLFRTLTGVSILFAWWLVPFMVLMIWSRYLVRHDWAVTAFDVGLLGIVLFFAVWFQRLATAAIARKEQRPGFRAPAIVGIAVLLVGCAISYGAIEGEPADTGHLSSGLYDSDPDTGVSLWLRTTVPIVLANLPIRAQAFANMDEQEVSGKAAGTIAAKPAPAQMGGVDLRYGSLKGAYLRGAFMRGADLRGANLVAADLREADLRGANLQGTYLFKTDLQEAEIGGFRLLGLPSLIEAQARIAGAYLAEANLRKAELPYADLKRAILVKADLREADLRGADLTNASLAGARLNGAKLMGAKLSNVVLDGASFDRDALTDQQLAEACIVSETDPPTGIRRPGRCVIDATEMLAAPSCEPRPSCTIFLISGDPDFPTLAAAVGLPGEPRDDVAQLLDNPLGTNQIVFGKALVGHFYSGTPVPPGRDGIRVVTIPPGDGRSGYFKAIFVAPKIFSKVSLSGRANVDDVGRVFLNGRELSPSLLTRAPGVIMEYGDTLFSTANAKLFSPGERNELLIADVNTGGGPSGAAFWIEITFTGD